MKKLIPLIGLFTFLFFTGCSDTMLTENNSQKRTNSPVVSTQDAPSKFRNAQLLPAAQSKLSGVRAGKGGDKGPEGEIILPDMFAVIGYSGFEPDGVTRRRIDAYALTSRILDEYGVTRRVLEDYGVTQRVLEEYGVTRRVLDEFGLTRRVLEEYGISQRMLDQYNISMEDFEAALTAFDPSVKVRTASDGAISVWISGRDVTSILSEMNDDPAISYIEPDPEAQISGLGSTLMTKNKDAQFLPWGIENMGASLNIKNASNVEIFILDSGVQGMDLKLETRKDFTMLFLNREQLVHEDTEWNNPGLFDPGTAGNPEDENGHGTHVAGTIGAIDNAEGVLGAAPSIKLHSLKVLTADGRTDITTLVAAINYVVYQKKNVLELGTNVIINLSLGMDIGTTSFNALDEAVLEAIDSGIVVVVSAGNNGEDASTYSPAHVPEAITVGAMDNQNRMANFSNFGASIDLQAPGKDIVSLPRTRSDYDRNYRVLQSGTSMAAPHVSAAAALYWSMHPNATPAEVQEGLKANAINDVTDAPAGTTTRRVSVLFAVDRSADRPFAFTKAEFNSSDGNLYLYGDGPTMSEVTFSSASSGTGIGSATIGTDGKFEVKFKIAGLVPCGVTAALGADAQKLRVANAPADCEGATQVASAPVTTPIVFGKHEWDSKKKEFRIDGTGPKNVTYEIRSESGELFAVTTSDDLGDWKYGASRPSWVPCVAVVSAAGQNASIEILGARAGECRQ